MNPLQMFNMLSQAKNPMGLLQQMSSKNPQLKRVLEVVNGKSPQELRQYVENTAKTQGVDLTQLAQKLGLQLPQ
ncbi:MAG: hypothetical protein IJX99_05690 [Clostridia bacterium]|nr:hypothetical protein [Clostridia bacterium]